MPRKAFLQILKQLLHILKVTTPKTTHFAARLRHIENNSTHFSDHRDTESTEFIPTEGIFCSLPAKQMFPAWEKIACEMIP